MAKTVTGSVYDLGVAAAVNSTLRFTYASAPATAYGGLVSSRDDRIAKVAIDGSFSVVLTAGFYSVSIDDSPKDVFFIDVDDVTETVDIVDIITSAVGTAPAPTGTVPVASSTALGKVKTNDDEVSPIAITQAHLEAAGARIRNGHFELYNSDQAKWFPIFVTGAAGLEQIAIGAADLSA